MRQINEQTKKKQNESKICNIDWYTGLDCFIKCFKFKIT